MNSQSIRLEKSMSNQHDDSDSSVDEVKIRECDSENQCYPSIEEVEFVSKLIITVLLVNSQFLKTGVVSTPLVRR